MNEVLDGSELFFGCRVKADELHAVHYARGERVSDQLDGEPCIGVIACGSVDVYSVSEDHNEVNVSSLGEGDSFGICNVFAPAALTTVLRCRQPADVVFIPKRTLVRLMADHPGLAVRYATVCNRKIQFLLERIELLSMQSCRTKLARYLLERDDGGKLLLPCSKEQLAKVLGVSRAALFREMAAFQKEGLLAVDGASVVILKRERLANWLRDDCRGLL